MLTIELAWPDRALWQNARTHWRVRHAATAAARKQAAWISIISGARQIAITGRPVLAWRLWQPPRSRADLSNVIGALKPAIDGIQDALGIDDGHFLHQWPEEFEGRCKGGRVLVTITERVNDEHSGHCR